MILIQRFNSIITQQCPDYELVYLNILSIFFA